MNAPECAEKIFGRGISLAEYVKLGNVDARIVAEETLTAPAWCASEQAGRPDADLTKRPFGGRATVRQSVIDTLLRVPMPARWWGCHAVLWLQVGRGLDGMMARLRGNTRHVIALDGGESDELLPFVIAHEMAHAVHAPADLIAEPTRSVSVREEAAIDLAFATLRGETLETAARRAFRDERLAYDTAARWGFPSSRVCPDAQRLAHFRDEMLAAQDRAAEIVAELQPVEGAA
jgi:hypothetical protein